MLEKEQLFSLVILIILIVAIILWLYLTIRSIRLQKRIENYIVLSDDFQNVSLVDKMICFFDQITTGLTKKLKQMKMDRVLYPLENREIDRNQELRFLAIKILSSFILTVIYFISVLATAASFSVLATILVLILGFYIPNAVSYIRKEIARKQIEKDLLKAISLMSNSFQAGKSIIQAIQNVSDELDGPLALEFNKMYQDMLHGLSFETAFNRFYERVELEDIKYITAILSILDKTGGNIMEVFASVEKSLYTRRKLDMELKATIASSHLVFQILVLLPLLLWIVIGLWNPSYFHIFFESTLGVLLFIIILCIYLIYIIVIRSIMKVEKY